jgi:hypothetical protein
MTKIEAVTALKFLDSHSRLKRFSKKFRKEIRSYHCPLCNWWHLTSKTNEFLNKEEREIKILFKDTWFKLLNNKEDGNNNDQ